MAVNAPSQNTAASTMPRSLDGIEALARGWAAADGHFDELRAWARNGPAVQDARALAPVWQEFFARTDGITPGDMDRRFESLQRQVRDNGVTYNVYADAEGPQRPWSLDLFPLIIDAAQWRHIEAGVLQRTRLLEAILHDTYGEQTLVARGLLPAALVHGHPGYLRPLHGALAAGERHLHIAAFDLARGPDGLWWLVGQRCQAPSGLGYLLENRLAVARQFGQAFQGMNVQRLAGTYRALIDSLKAHSPAGKDAHIALLTPGPYNETYFEHAYLARYLGLTLVQGSDLLVRDERLYLKTLKGLEPIHVLLKRVDDQYMDPLELRADSTLGVPGLLQAMRAGHVLVANAPGSAFLESPALLGFLPGLAQHLLGEELVLPALPTWWCGERSAMQEALATLGTHTIKPTYPGSSIHHSFESVLGPKLGAQALREWSQRIAAHGDDHTLQAFMPLSQLPTWSGPRPGQAGHMVAKSTLLRVFVTSDGLDSAGRPRWRVLPGGLARVADPMTDIASMQRGGGSADVWALTEGVVDTTTLLSAGQPVLSVVGPRKRLVTSRAAENLYWLGRYSERAENTVRLARLTLDCLGGEELSSPPLLEWLHTMALGNCLVLPGVPSPLVARRVFERSLIAGLASNDGATSVGFNLRALRLAAASVRERLSQEHWSLIMQSEEALFASCAQMAGAGDYAPGMALRALKTCSDHLVAITGAQTDRMTRDDGWRLLSIGRHVERLVFLSDALLRGLRSRSLRSDSGFEAVLALFDSTITYRGQYQQSRDLGALVDLLVLDGDNPRSLAWVVQTLRGRLSRLAGVPKNQWSELALQLPDPDTWSLTALCAPEDGDTDLEALQTLLLLLRDAAFDTSNAISATYFTHTGLTGTSVGN
ncbi:MAG: A circularly permuted ATPgrasp family protein [Rhodoferax sp.]|nr:MAG: A circularly permuted ATPgrasp family protein [Rhodoferax sp.]